MPTLAHRETRADAPAEVIRCVRSRSMPRIDRARARAIDGISAQHAYIGRDGCTAAARTRARSKGGAAWPHFDSYLFGLSADYHTPRRDPFRAESALDRAEIQDVERGIEQIDRCATTFPRVAECINAVYRVIIPDGRWNLFSIMIRFRRSIERSVDLGVYTDYIYFFFTLRLKIILHARESARFATCIFS